MKIMRTKDWLAPLVFTLFSMLVAVYLLLGLPPKNNSVEVSAGLLAAELLHHFTVLAEAYAKEEADSSRAQP